MNLSMGNKNVVIGLVVMMVYLSMTFCIERTAALLGFHDLCAVWDRCRGHRGIADEG